MLLHFELAHKLVSSIFDEFRASGSNESYDLYQCSRTQRERRYAMEYKGSPRIQKKGDAAGIIKIFESSTSRLKEIDDSGDNQDSIYNLKIQRKATHKPRLNNLQSLF